jgi:ubiquinol-cytochrome c reductase cytochrome c1 subunit
MNKGEAKKWFGATPPDLTVIARARGADWLYTYLRSFYKDDTRPTGWNNVVFDKVGMPHVLYELQGEQVLKHEGEGEHAVATLVLEKPGKMTQPEYNAMVGDLVNYLVYMGEPARNTRITLGVIVLVFLGLFFVVAYYLKKEYWKDVH